MTTAHAVPRVIVVRHAMPELDPHLPPAEWALSADGRVAASGLRERLPRIRTAIASSERKAQETLRLAHGVDFIVDARLDEVRRPTEPFGPGIRERRRAWVAGIVDERHQGWEAPHEAAARFDGAVSSAPPGDVIVASHGMVLTAWLVSRGVARPGEAAAAF